MQKRVESLILEATKATEAKEVGVIQELWSGYGQIKRVALKGADVSSVILKHIVLPHQVNHPRGWNTNLSHQRKLKSYQVEMLWYLQYSSRCEEACRVAHCYSSINEENEQFILLEDLDAAGYPVRKSYLNLNEVKLCIDWLANFHATFMMEKPIGLWEVGSYWHLDTRPEEYQQMKAGALKQAAHQIDKTLNQCRYKTIIHGDAKVANFCFAQDMKSVAAVDFQYVGGGCGMKDLAYLLGSCLTEEECELFEEDLLSFYFDTLKQAIDQHEKHIDFNDLEREWRLMYPIAWTDFSRFLMGWMPTHQKLNSYTKKKEQEVLQNL